MKKVFETLSEAFAFLDEMGAEVRYQIIKYGNCVVVRIW